MTDFLEANFDEDTAWFLYIGSDAVTIDDQATEMLQHLSGLFDAFGDFIIPTKVTLHCRELAGNDTISERKSEARDAPYRKHTYTSAEGVELTTIMDDFRQLNDLYISQVSIDDHKVKIELESGIYCISCDSPRYRYPEDSSATIEDPIWEPVDPGYMNFGDWDGVENDETPFSYLFPVSLHSDIWYEETDLAKRNQQNLREFLERVETNLPVISVRRERGLHSPEQLKEIY